MAKNRRSSRGARPPGERKTGARARIPQQRETPTITITALQAVPDPRILSRIRKRRASEGALSEGAPIGEDGALDVLRILASDLGGMFTLDMWSLNLALENGLSIDDALIDLMDGGSPRPRPMGSQKDASLATIQSVINNFILAILIRIVDRLKAGASMAEALEGQAIEIERFTEKGVEKHRREKANG